MQVVPGGHRCECGNRGCWEQYASGNALGREARELAAADSPVAQGLLSRVDGDAQAITGPIVTAAAKDGDPVAIELLEEVGGWLGIGLANLAAALDPGTFVIGGGVCDAGELLLGPGARRVPPDADGPRIPPRGAGGQGGARPGRGDGRGRRSGP